MKKSLFETIKKIVKKNGGITISHIGNNGFSEIKMNRGYIVSIEKHGKKLKRFNYKSVKSYIEKNKDLIGINYFGIWYNANNKIYYLDINKHFDEKYHAIFYGINQNQLSIWDIEKNDSIDLASIYLIDYFAGL